MRPDSIARQAYKQPTAGVLLPATAKNGRHHPRERVMTSAVKATSTANRAAFVAACALGVILSAHDAAAQTTRPAMPHLGPGKSVEMVTPAAAITSTAHYQTLLQLSCVGLTCSGDFPKPGSHHQLNITRVSCHVEGAAGSTFRWGDIDLYSASNTFALQQYLPLSSSSPEGFHQLDRAVDLQVVGGQHMQVILQLSSNASNGFCSATGTLSTLG
jgi:hypothetical protein